MKTLAILLFMPLMAASGQSIPHNPNHPFAKRILVAFEERRTQPITEEDNYKLHKYRVGNQGLGLMDSGYQPGLMPGGLPVINLSIPLAGPKGGVVKLKLEPEFHPEENLVRYHATINEGEFALIGKTVLKVDMENVGKQYSYIGGQRFSWTAEGYITEGWMQLPMDGPLLVNLSMSIADGSVTQTLQTVYIPQ